MIFHERDSGGRFNQILKSHWGAGRSGVVHCFSGNQKELEEYLAMGLYIGITGVITIQSRGVELRRLAMSIPLDRLLVETDAPYLTPTPERNKHRRNEPAFVRTVFFALANVLGVEPQRLSRAIWANSCRLFNWTPPEVD
jgi:TatD DNase family protein